MQAHLFRAALLPALLAASLLTNGCSKLDAVTKLPPETTTGEGTFGCNVDGQLWLPRTESMLDSKLEPEFSGSGFSMRAERETKTDADYIYLSELAKVFSQESFQPEVFALYSSEAERLLW